MKKDRMKVNGLSGSADILEFVYAIENHLHNESNIKVYEAIPGTCKAFGNLLKRFENCELSKDLTNLFYECNCTFIASWNVDDLDSDYRARIDMSRMPILTASRIIKLDKAFRKVDIKKEKEIIEEQESNIRKMLIELKNKKR